jgi:hypothetical protein
MGTVLSPLGVKCACQVPAWPGKAGAEVNVATEWRENIAHGEAMGMQLEKHRASLEEAKETKEAKLLASFAIDRVGV